MQSYFAFVPQTVIMTGDAGASGGNPVTDREARPARTERHTRCALNAGFTRPWGPLLGAYGEVERVQESKIGRKAPT